MHRLNRRDLLKLAGGALLASRFPAALAASSSGRVVVIGGGAAGTIVAKHLRNADPGIDVTLIERNPHYQTTLMSNTLLSQIEFVDTHTFSYEGLTRRGIKLVHQTVTGINAETKTVVTSAGSISYDRLIIAPGFGHSSTAIEGYDKAAEQLMPDAWKTPKETVLLREQIEKMRPGGTVLVATPRTAISCPSGPYERVSHIAHFLKKHNPRAKILIIDANDQFRTQDLFMQAWENFYPGMIEWVKGSDTKGGIRRVDAKSMKLFAEGTDFHADVANVILPQRAGDVATLAGVVDSTGWAPVDPTTFESTKRPGIHVIGDAASVGALPKSAQIANSQAIVCAGAVVALLNGGGDAARKSMPAARFFEIAYNIVAPNYAFSSIDVYRPTDDRKGVIRVSGGQSPSNASAEHRNREFAYAQSWYNNITHDMFS